MCSFHNGRPVTAPQTGKIHSDVFPARLADFIRWTLYPPRRLKRYISFFCSCFVSLPAQKQTPEDTIPSHQMGNTNTDQTNCTYSKIEQGKTKDDTEPNTNNNDKTKRTNPSRDCLCNKQTQPTILEQTLDILTRIRIAM